jgi:DNA-binding NarL/FixJ family response regulator
MRVILVGPASDRDRLRSRMDGSITVVGEFDTVGAARKSDVRADAILMVPGEDLEEMALPEPLTSREVQVLELLAEGLSNKAIAARLGISDQTVKFHVASITGKLGAANRTDAVRRAVRRGLISL